MNSETGKDVVAAAFEAWASGDNDFNPVLPAFSTAKRRTDMSFVHELPSDAFGNANAASNYARIQVLTPVGGQQCQP